MNLIRPITIVVNDKHHDCCSEDCQLFNRVGYNGFCGSVALSEDKNCNPIRTDECSRDAKENNGTL